MKPNKPQMKPNKSKPVDIGQWKKAVQLRYPKAAFYRAAYEDMDGMYTYASISLEDAAAAGYEQYVVQEDGEFQVGFFDGEVALVGNEMAGDEEDVTARCVAEGKSKTLADKLLEGPGKSQSKLTIILESSNRQECEEGIKLIEEGLYRTIERALYRVNGGEASPISAYLVLGDGQPQPVAPPSPKGWH